ncbi:patatin-like phospholipase family protein [Chondromyces apiculatus]|uniref:Patatin n=1 Tax=Chondromyces apiculatus DSM 436 TaxID=1192034 RepID=A0A017TDZ6_9BACT|nr:patatin-like phospholipase family protein [Chondromyces apiculatus]EYF07513.1 Patatin [Chondromyces apiculatus DSM 436]
MSPPTHDAPPRRKVAVILSGGGARGAYEVGVLSYILDAFARVRGRPPRIDVLCGTSVGAINACFLAAHLNDPTLGIRRLIDLWNELQLEAVLGFGMKQALSLPRLMLGGGQSGAGIFDVAPMAKIIEKEIPWRAIARTLRHGHLSALSVSATEIATGRTVIFMQTGPDGALPSQAPPRTVIRGAHIGPLHALASASIPLLFPPVRIGNELYMDGGIRQNTPIAPALWLGATHVLAIGLSRELRDLHSVERKNVPRASLVLGKVLNAFLLDHVQSDFEVLSRVNSMIDDGEKAFGPSFLPSLNAVATRRGVLPYRRVKSLVVRPSVDLGRMAASHIRTSKLRSGPLVTRQLLSLMDVGEDTEADLASYLLFDGPFTQKLIALGRADAEARRRELLEFFGSAQEDPEPLASEREEWSIPPPVGPGRLT